ncbi:MAG: HipA domain-containing protein [Clostridiales Family XIII bacterium]|jgi:serine/threonine-protein kinase HipA|nr:HipA domain-containing protein [Clostridiales Family XIII bacterium]
MISEREAYVYITLPGDVTPVTAGKFALEPLPDGSGIGRFVYARSYLERGDAVAIDPVELKLKDHVYETGKMNGMFGAIRDATPDFWGRTLLERRFPGETLGELDYLLRSPDDHIGALGFGRDMWPSDPAPSGSAFNNVTTLEAFQEIADEIAFGKPGEQGVKGSLKVRIETLLMPGTSMGGARPKMQILYEDDLWIAKCNLKEDRWNNALVELAMLRLAKQCGIRVPETRAIKAGGRDVLLVKRFDRANAGNGFRKHRMVSGLTILQAEDRVADRERWSYPTLAETLRKFSAAPAEDARELYRRMVFNALISNTDDHPRNHAFIAEDGWRLSPAYDLTPTPLVSIERRDLAMICGTQGRFANEKNLLSESRRFLTDPEEAKNMVENMAATVRAKWEKTARLHGVSKEDCNRIRPAFAYEGFFL